MKTIQGSKMVLMQMEINIDMPQLVQVRENFFVNI